MQGSRCSTRQSQREVSSPCALHSESCTLRPMISTDPVVLVSRRGEDRVRQGHPWIYRSDVVRVEAGPGDLVTVVGPRDRRLGAALYSDRSQIALRMVAVGDEKVTPDFWRARLPAAVPCRESLPPH